MQSTALWHTASINLLYSTLLYQTLMTGIPVSWKWTSKIQENHLHHFLCSRLRCERLSNWSVHVFPLQCLFLTLRLPVMDSGLISGYCIWCGYEVPGTILLHNLKGAMQLDRTKDMSLHVSTCTSYYFNTLMPVVCKLWRWYDVFLHFITKISYQFLEQQINIKFWMKLGKNANDTYAMLFEVYVGESMEKSSVSGINGSKRGMGNDNAHHFLLYQGYWWLWIHSTKPNSQQSLLCENNEAVTWSWV